jgi:hypothetical protein
MKKMLTFLVLTLMTATANAAIITVDFEIQSTSSSWGDGSFSGEDTNLDGLLSFDELVSFNGSNNIENETVDLSTLFDVGDFDIATNTWLSNALGWTTTENAWFTWNDQTNSVNSSWASATITSASYAVDVPAPATLSLFAIGLLLMARSRRKL